MMRGKIIIVAAVFLVALAVFLPKSEYARVRSPDETLVAVAYYRTIQSLLPLSPGQSGDQPGWIKIENGRGEMLGEKSVEMVSFIHSLEWKSDGPHVTGVGKFY